MGFLLCNMGFLQTLNLPEGAPMPSPVRDRMISGALDLLARRGLQATSFAEVTQATQTPRGSIYHHFPGGKQELVLAAIDLNAQQWLDVVASVERRSPEQVVSELLGRLRTYLDETKFEAGSAVGAVTVAAENPTQLEHCCAAFDAFKGGLAKALTDCSVTTAAAREYASLLTSSMIGMTMTARAARSYDGFDASARQLVDSARRLPRS